VLQSIVILLILECEVYHFTKYAGCHHHLIRPLTNGPRLQFVKMPMRRHIQCTIWLLVVNLFQLGGAGKLLLMADVHYDAYYDPSRGPSCQCNAEFDDALETCKFPSTSESTDGLFVGSTNWGQFGCDSPSSLVASAFAAAAATLPTPDVLVFAGDFMSHHSASEADTLAGVGEVASAMANAFPYVGASGRPYAVVLGNADLVEDYHFDFVAKSDANNDYLERVARVWQRSSGVQPSLGYGLDAAANSTSRKGGYYASSPVPGEFSTHDPWSCPDEKLCATATHTHTRE